MDYFSELLESYDKLKKRTFKLTYLTEAEDKKKKKEEKEEPKTDAATMQKAKAAADNAIAKAPSIASSEIVSNGLKVDNVLGEPTGLIIYKNITNGSVGVQGLGPQGGILSIDKYDTKTKTVARVPDAYNKFVEKLAGETELSKTSQESLEQDKTQEQLDAEAAEAAFEALAKPETIFLEKIDEETGEPVYNVDPEDPTNILGAVKALTETFKALVNYCVIRTQPKPIYCDNMGSYLTGQARGAFGFKLANGIAIDEDGKVGNLTPGLIDQAARSNKDFMKFLTGEGDCETIGRKVGHYDGKLFLFGEDTNDKGEPRSGVVIKTTNELQNDALEAVKNQCPDFKARELRGPQSPNQHGLNTIRATVDEKCMVAAVSLAHAQTNEERQEVFRDIAAYISGKGQALIEYAKVKVGEDVALDLEAYSEEEILMEQANLASTDGGRPLVRYTMMTILRHMQFAQAMGADSAGDLSKAGGSGARSDTVLYYKEENRATAEAACELLGLDPNKALTPSEESGYAWELGVGQKDKMHSIGDAKLGEYNTAARRVEAIRGEFLNDAVDEEGNPIVDDEGNPVQVAAQDKQFQEGFTEWADQLQFGDEGQESDRFKEFLKFEEELEADVTSMQQLVDTGGTYLGDGKIKALSPEGVCKELGEIVKGKLSYDDLKDTELGKALAGEGLDFKNAADRNRASELIGRQARIKMVKEALDDPAKQQAAKDWIIRNAVMTGGNYRDIVTVITSHDDNKSLAIKHNKPFQNMTAKGANVSFTFPEGGSTIGISAGGVPCSLGFEGTNSAAGRETRTLVKIDKETASKIGTDFDGIPANSENSSTFIQYLEGQKQLLEMLLNQPKRNQVL